MACDLGNDSVDVRVRRRIEVKGRLADAVEGLVIEAEGHVAVLEEGVGREHTVVRLHHRGGDLRGRSYHKVELALAAVVHREALEDEGAEARAGAAARGVVHEEALEAGARVGELADAVEGQVEDFLADGVVAAGVIVGRVLLAGLVYYFSVLSGYFGAATPAGG